MSIHCGHCEGVHETIGEVRWCASNRFINTSGSFMGDTVRTQPSKKQLNYAQMLLHQKVPVGHLAHLETTQGIEAAEEYINGRNRAEISDVIGALRKQPDRTDKAPSGAKVQVDEGFYRHGDAIFKVVRALDTNHLYAKKIEEDGSATFVPGMLHRLDPEKKLTLDEAKQWGQLYGRCMSCGRRLTKEESIAAGIGPVCADNWKA